MKGLPSQLPYTDDHNTFRDMVRDFVNEKVAPNHEQWEKDKIVPREIWAEAGQLGMICPNFPAEYGAAEADFLYNVIVIEELARVGASGFFDEPLARMSERSGSSADARMSRRRSEAV